MKRILLPILATLLCLTAPASAAPPAPVITAPGADTKIADGEKRVELRWRPAGDATVYEVQLLTEGSARPFLAFMTSGLDARLRDAEADVIFAELAAHPTRRLLWRVRGFEQGKPGPWSATRSFTVGAALPQGPVMFAAINGRGGGAGGASAGGSSEAEINRAAAGTLEASIQDVRANVQLAYQTASTNAQGHPDRADALKAILGRGEALLSRLAHVREGNERIEPLLVDSRTLLTDARLIDPDYRQRAIEGPR